MDREDRLMTIRFEDSSVLAERVGQGGCTAVADSAWWPLQLPAQLGVENAPFSL